MGKIIKFPHQEIRKEREFDELLDSIDYPSEELRRCVKKNVIPVLLKYNQLPEHSFKIEVSSSITSSDIDICISKVQEEVKIYAARLQLNMLQEMLKLYVALCKCEMRNQ
jgi:hypothetical protein